MSRETVCFSMYSLMSIRIIASWESNMNSARARASSVFPTPVGPRKRNVPIGRLGSCRPARERRSAVATASIASSCPTTRSCRRSEEHTSELQSRRDLVCRLLLEKKKKKKKKTPTKKKKKKNNEE